MTGVGPRIAKRLEARTSSRLRASMICVACLRLRLAVVMPRRVDGFADRLIGSIRRECLDHIVVFGEAHLRRILRSDALLQQHQDPSITGQGCAGFSPGSADREHQIVLDPGRTPSPLRPGLNFRYTQL